MGNQEVNLSPREYALLLCLLRNRGQVLSRSQLLDKVWGLDFEGGERAVDVQVKAPEAVEVNMTLIVKPAEGTAFEAAKAAVESELAGFFGGRLLGQSVKLAELYSRIYALDAVENCRITLPAADTEISATELPVLGTVSITEEA